MTARQVRKQPVEAVPTNPLSTSEVQALRMLAVGLTTRQIADRLKLSPTSITNRVSRAARKLGTTTAVNTVLVAHCRGYLRVAVPAQHSAVTR